MDALAERMEQEVLNLLDDPASHPTLPCSASSRASFVP